MIKCHWCGENNATSFCIDPTPGPGGSHFAECEGCAPIQYVDRQIAVTEEQYILAKTEELLND